MSPLQEAHALLKRQQIDKIILDGELEAAQQGTVAYGDLARRQHQMSTDLAATRARIRTLSAGSQTSLL